MADKPEGLPWDDTIAGAWKVQVDGAIKKQQSYHGWWAEALKNYSPSVQEDPTDYGLQIRTNRTFTLVERKRAELFFQQPDLQVAPSPLLETHPDGATIASAHATILNERLGLDGVQIKLVAQQAIFDYLLFGIGVTKVGYRAHTKLVEQQTGEQPVIDPVTGAAAVDPMTGQPQMTPVMSEVPVIVKGECFWESVPPKQYLLPASWRSIQFDKAPWQAMRFTLARREAERLYGKDVLRPAPSSTQAPPDDAFDHGDRAPVAATDVVSGVELWYRSSLYRDDIVHPDHLTQLVLIDGIDTPVQHRDSPYQEFDERGKLTADSMIGFPFHPMVLRPLTDSAYIMSDVALALPLTKELDKFREQMIVQRDISLSKWFYNTDTLPPEEIDKIVRARQGGMIGVPPDAYMQPGGPIQPLPSGPYPRENFQYNDYIDNDLARTHAIDATSAGTSAESGLTATEANLRQQNVNIRLGAEQAVVADWLVTGATKYSSLLQRFLESEDIQAIVGPQAGAIWEAWKTVAPARLSFTMLPDSSLKNDTPLHRKQLQDLFTYLANDPSLNRTYLTSKLLTAYHLDPSRAIVPQDQMPQPKPDPPNLSFAISGDDLNPLAPQMSIVLAIMELSGIPVPPEAVQKATQVAALIQGAQNQIAQATATPQMPTEIPPHGGKVAPIESLDKHAVDQTGGMQGSGVLSPGLSGGHGT